MIRNAAEFTFSWSLRRQEMWNCCRRKYFLHYYAARGGHDPDSGGELRRLHEMRSLLSERAYLHRLIAAELRRRFYRPHEEEDAELPDSEAGPYGAVPGRLRREFRRMLRDEFRTDHAHPMLAALYYNSTPPGELLRDLEKRLRNAMTAMSSGPLAMLARTRYLFRRPIDSPLEVAVGELRCFAAPILAFEEKGVLTIVEGSGADSTVLLHKFHAANKLHIPPERVRSLELIPGKGALRLAGKELNISRTLREIRGGAAEMLNAVRPDGTVREEDFPRNPAHCTLCRFRGHCR